MAVNTDEPNTFPALYVSAISGGGDAMRDVETAIFDLGRIVEREKAGVPSTDPHSEGVVDVTFHLPGTFFRPDYKGLRTGRWVPRKRLIVIQVAVPESPGDRKQIRAFLAASLREAVGVASTFFAEKNHRLSTARASLIAERAAAALTA